jgi:hypothetical protein
MAGGTRRPSVARQAPVEEQSPPEHNSLRRDRIVGRRRHVAIEADRNVQFPGQTAVEARQTEGRCADGRSHGSGVRRTRSLHDAVFTNTANHTLSPAGFSSLRIPINA